MRSYARRRDSNEKAIIEALRAAGASVQQLDEVGVPDLLVGYAGKTWLVEVKDEHGKAEKRSKRTEIGLRDTQEKWWAAWKGGPLVTVCTVEEALAVIGVAHG
jgi:hypothetical protein